MKIYSMSYFVLSVLSLSTLAADNTTVDLGGQFEPAPCDITASGTFIIPPINYDDMPQLGVEKVINNDIFVFEVNCSAPQDLMVRFTHGTTVVQEHSGNLGTSAHSIPMVNEFGYHVARLILREQNGVDLSYDDESQPANFNHPSLLMYSESDPAIGGVRGYTLDLSMVGSPPPVYRRTFQSEIYYDWQRVAPGQSTNITTQVMATVIF